MGYPKILHTADWHVMNSSRHDEYESVFTKLIKYVEDNFEPRDYVVIVGDLFHSKNVISPESVVLLIQTMRALCEVCNVVVVPGNHDTNLANSTRMCSIETLAEAMPDEENFHYLPDSGLYELKDDGIVFGNFSILDDESKWPVKIEKEPGKRYIALFHGALAGSRNDVGVEIHGEGEPDKLFGDYDLALLGDIHNRQFLSQVSQIEEVVEDPSGLEHEIGYRS